MANRKQKMANRKQKMTNKKQKMTNRKQKITNRKQKITNIKADKQTHNKETNRQTCKQKARKEGKDKKIAGYRFLYRNTV